MDGRYCIETGDQLVLDAVQALESLGLKSGIDNGLIAIARAGAVERIKNTCNISKIPDGLYHTAVMRLCGEYLYFLRMGGKLDIGELDLTGAAVKSLQVGDTDVSFGSGDGNMTDEQKADVLINALRNAEKGELLRYRKLSW